MVSYLFFDAWTPRALSLLRLICGAQIVQHGAQKLFGILAAHTPGPAPFSQMWIGGVIEFVGGILLIIGLLTRPAAFLLSGTMAVAYFQFHAPKSFFPVVNEGDLAVTFCILFLFLVFAGGGSWSLDSVFRKPQPAS
ncbi:MAG: DoxX family protein [Fimbriimonas sp.]|nr:DoxX family protein [Fimbriimonas sp.]